MKESDLAQHIVDHLEKQGYTAYKEVCMRGRGGNARSDCYFVKYDDQENIIETIAVETKLNLTLTVIQQADRWRKNANKVYVCVPTTGRKGLKSRRFAIKVCKSLGIGVYQLDKTCTIKESVCSEHTNKYTIPPLYEQQKDSVAGNDQSEFYTAFKHTVNQIHSFMEDKEQHNWSDLITEIDHHYKTDTSAKSALKKMIGGSVIEGYYLGKIEKKFFLIKGEYFKS